MVSVFQVYYGGCVPLFDMVYLCVIFECFFPQQEKRIFTNFHRQLFCWIDNWYGLTMADIRKMEEETQRELEEVKTIRPAAQLSPL